MRMMLDVFWNGMKRKSADLRGGSSALSVMLQEHGFETSGIEVCCGTMLSDIEMNHALDCILRI